MIRTIFVKASSNPSATILVTSISSAGYQLLQKGDLRELTQRTTYFYSDTELHMNYELDIPLRKFQTASQGTGMFAFRKKI